VHLVVLNCIVALPLVGAPGGQQQAEPQPGTALVQFVTGAVRGSQLVAAGSREWEHDSSFGDSELARRRDHRLDACEPLIRTRVHGTRTEASFAGWSLAADDGQQPRNGYGTAPFTSLPPPTVLG